MLTREEVLKIAHLARLELTETEVTSYQERLGRVLDYVKELSSAATGQEFMSPIPSDAVSSRTDEPHPFPEPSLLLKNSPASEENCFLLPPVVERS